MDQAAPERPATIHDRVRARMPDLTDAERRLAAHLLDRSLVPGLQSVHRLAQEAEASAPTVVRLARKLGFRGFPELQDAIRGEVAARVRPPLARMDDWDAPDPGHRLARFARAATGNIARTLDRLDLAGFDRAAAMLADPARRLHLAGGRITRSNALAFAGHLQLIRAGVVVLDPAPAAWPQALLDVGPSSVLVLFDIRRYERDLERLAGIVAGQGGAVVLFTDQWGSPAERHAAITFRAHVEAPSAWDSTLALALLVEALAAEVQRRIPGAASERIRALEETLGQTRAFRTE